MLSRLDGPRTARADGDRPRSPESVARNHKTTITFDSVPGDPSPYTLNPATRTARRAVRGVEWLHAGSVGVTWRQPVSWVWQSAPGLDDSFNA